MNTNKISQAEGNKQSFVNLQATILLCAGLTMAVEQWSELERSLGKLLLLLKPIHSFLSV